MDMSWPKNPNPNPKIKELGSFCPNLDNVYGNRQVWRKSYDSVMGYADYRVGLGPPRPGKVSGIIMGT